MSKQEPIKLGPNESSVSISNTTLAPGGPYT